MTGPTSNLAVSVAIGFVAGLAVGGLHFASLSWNAQLFVAGSVGKAIALQVARVALAALILILLVRLNRIAALSGAFGFLAARAVALSRYGEDR
ncbi:MAG: hypothetical protein JO223_19945 [Hyphomicrobiales bacterium]|nr:hypothetical protein [Hyphomicrobiales bacterium]MBV8439093.1 hypothetical protein [Hyphomicrobiales bacterium]